MVVGDFHQLSPQLLNDHEKRYNFIHQQRSLLNVLRRPIEIAATSGRSLAIVREAGIAQMQIFRSIIGLRHA